MPKLIFFLLPLLFSTTVFSQSNKKVDEKNGFLEFKFGKKTTDFKAKIKKIPSNIQNNNTLRFKLSSPEYKKVFGYDVKEIELEFYNDRLYAITINFVEENTDIAYSYILYKLQNIFGESSANLEPESSFHLMMLEGEAWIGTKTVLYLHKIQIKSTSKLYASLYYKNKAIEKEMEKSEF